MNISSVKTLQVILIAARWGLLGSPSFVSCSAPSQPAQGICKQLRGKTDLEPLWFSGLWPCLLQGGSLQPVSYVWWEASACRWPCGHLVLPRTGGWVCLTPGELADPLGCTSHHTDFSSLISDKAVMVIYISWTPASVSHPKALYRSSRNI